MTQEKTTTNHQATQNITKGRVSVSGVHFTCIFFPTIQQVFPVESYVDLQTLVSDYVKVIVHHNKPPSDVLSYFLCATKCNLDISHRTFKFYDNNLVNAVQATNKAPQTEVHNHLQLSCGHVFLTIHLLRVV